MPDIDPNDVQSAFVDQFSHPDVMRSYPPIGSLDTEPRAAYAKDRGVQAPTFTGDEAINSYASQAGDLFEKHAGNLGLDADAIKKSRKQVEDQLRARAQTHVVGSLAKKIQDDGAVGPGSPEYLFRRAVLFGPHVADYGRAKELEQAQKNFEAGNAGYDDYHAVARKFAEQGQPERGGLGQFTDILSQLPETAAEFMLPGGPGKGGMFSKAGQMIVKQAPTMPLRVGSAVQQMEAPTPTITDKGVEWTEGQKPFESWTKALVGDVVTQGVFGGADAFALQAGKNMLTQVAKGVGKLSVVSELSEDAKKVLQVAPEGGPVWQFGQALKSGDKEQIEKAAVRLVSNTAALSVFEAGMHLPHKGTNTPTAKDVQHGIDTLIKEAAKVEPAKPAETATATAELLPERKTPEAPLTPPVEGEHPAATAFKASFPEAQVTPSGELKATVGEGQHARDVYLSDGSKENSVRVDFGYTTAERTGVGKGGLEQGSLQLARGLKDFLGRFKDTGHDLEYVAIGGREKIYQRALEKAGYEQVGGPTGEGNDLRTWRPKAQEPAKTEAPAPPAAGVQPSGLVDVRERIARAGGNSAKAIDELNDQIKTHLEAGGQASLWFDGKETPLAGHNGKYALDAQGQPWGLLPLAMGTRGTTNGVEFKEPPKTAAPPPPQPEKAQPPAETPREKANRLEKDYQDQQKALTSQGMKPPAINKRLKEQAKVLDAARIEAANWEAAQRPATPPETQAPARVTEETEEGGHGTTNYVPQNLKTAAKQPEKTPITSVDKKEILDRAERGEGNLTDQEKHVLNNRLPFGVGFRELGEDLGVSHTQAANLEASALDKLGYSGTVDDYHGANQAGQRAVAKVENGAPPPIEELAAQDPGGAVHARREAEIEDAEQQLQALHDDMAARQRQGRKLTPTEQEDFDGEFKRLARIIDQGEAEAPEPAGQPPAGLGARAGETPVRPEPGPGVQPGAAPGQGEPPAQGGPGPAQRVPEVAAATAPGREAPGNVVGMGAAQDIPPNGPGGTIQLGMGGPPPSGPPNSTGRPWYQQAVDWLRNFGQKSFTALNRLSPNLSVKASTLANSRAIAEKSLHYFENILTVSPEAVGRPSDPEAPRSIRLADLTPDERNIVGAAFAEMRLRHNNSDKTFVGPGSPLPDEATYQRAIEGLWPFFQGWAQEWTPHVEANFRGIMGMEPNEAINSPTQVPGLPLNFRAIQEGEPSPPSAVQTKRGNLAALGIRRPGFTRQAEFSAPAYDLDIRSMMEHTLKEGGEAAAKADLIRSAVEAGVIAKVEPGDKAPAGWENLKLSPSRGLDLPANVRYYADPRAGGEFRKALAVDEPAGKILSGITAGTGLVNSLAIMSPVEMATHIANHVTAMFKPGMGVPIWNIKDSFANGFRLMASDPAYLGKIKDLAMIGASFTHREAQGFLKQAASMFGEKGKAVGEKIERWDPTYWGQKFSGGVISTMQDAVRIQLYDAYDKMAAKGASGFPDPATPEGKSAKRDFINQAVGNYNSVASNKLTQFLKDSGLQPFGVAASTFTSQGMRNLWGGGINVTPETAAGQVGLRALAYAKMMPMLALGPVLNHLFHGNPFPDNVPAFAIKTGEDEHEDEKGKKIKTVKYFDPMYFTGLRRGARATGVNAAIEGLREDKTGGQMIDQAARDIGHTFEHFIAGPIVQAVHTMATGENLMGHRVAPKVSTVQRPPEDAAAVAEVAKKKGMASPGSSQFLQNLPPALENINPLIGSIVGADRPAYPPSMIETFLKSAGPFAEKEKALRRQGKKVPAGDETQKLRERGLLPP